MLSGALILSMGSMPVLAASSDEPAETSAEADIQDKEENVSEQEKQESQEDTEEKKGEEQKGQLTTSEKEPEKKEETKTEAKKEESLGTGTEAALGGLKITGGTQGTDFSFDNGIITVLKETALEFTNESDAQTTTSIEAGPNVTAVNLTLNGVNIKATDKPALNLGEAAATITLKGTNKLVTEGIGAAVLTEKSFTIKGDGDLSATGAADYPGIGVTEKAQAIFQGTGVILGTGRGTAAGIGGGKDIKPGDGSIQIGSGNVSGVGGTDAQPVGRAKGDAKMDITGVGNTTAVYATVIEGLEKDKAYSGLAVKADDKDYTYGSSIKADSQGRITMYLPAGKASVTMDQKNYSGTVKDEKDGENPLTYEEPEPSPEAAKDISKVVVTGITAPVTGQEPDTKAKESSDEYSISHVTWTPEAEDSFKEKVRYTATVTVTPEEGYRFTDATVGTIDGKEADTLLEDGTLQLSYTFPATEEVVIHNPVTADSGNNRIAGIKPSMEVSYRAGAALKFQAIGDGSQPDDEQTLTPGEGDQRYVPVNWTCAGENGSWKKADKDGNYIDTVNTSATPGEHTLTVYFARETYSEDGQWERDDNKSTVKLTFKTAKTGSGTSGTGSSGKKTAAKSSTSSKSSNAKTGDTSPVAPLAFLAVAGAGCAAMILMKKKREDEEEE